MLTSSSGTLDKWHILPVSFLFLIYCSLKVDFSAGEIFSSYWDLSDLQSSEQDMLDMLESYVKSEESKLQEIKSLVEDRRKRLSESNITVGHPVTAYHMLNFWFNIDLKVQNNNSKVDLKRNFRKSRAPKVDRGDIKGALRAIIRLQTTYNLSTESLSRGQINGKISDPLSAQDCYLLGLESHSWGEDNLALEWQQMALQKTNDETEIAHIFMEIAEIFFQVADYAKAVKIINSVKIDIKDPKYPEYLERTREYERHRRLYGGFPWDREQDKASQFMLHYELLCRGEFKQTEPGASRGFCQIRRPFNYYTWVKEEVLSTDPWVSLVYDAVTDREATVLQELSVPKLHRATVGVDVGYLAKSDYRTGKVAWLEVTSPEGVVSRVTRRIEQITGLDTENRIHSSSAEKLQLANYGIGGQFEPHLDQFENISFTTPDKSSTELENSGDRMATVMLYLNEVEAGGFTVFTHLNITVRPVKNAALFWYNLKRSGVSDDRVEHAGCPVLLGSKWIANLWIHEYGQEFRRKCGRDISATDDELYSSR